MGLSIAVLWRQPIPFIQECQPLPVLNRIAGFADEMQAWRKHLHTIPEIDFDLPKTTAFVAEKLREFGVDELHEGLAQTGMVAIIHGRGEGGTIGLRADMDALPMVEETGVDYASTHDAAMHACGHDGHTTMLLGAAKYLAETRNFSGSVALIFQPAEEFGGGGRVMCEEGIMDRFDISQVYALHNAPGTPVGHFYTNAGPIMAAQDTFRIFIKGQGGHGAMPHETRDPVVAALGIATALQTIVSRNHYAFNELVLSVTQVQTGSADNVIPEYAFVGGTVRTYDKDVQKMVMRRMQQIVDGQAAAFDVEAKLEYEVGYPATINHAAETEFAASVAAEIVGPDAVEAASTPEMGAEDFAYMLEERPGCYLFIGNGDSAGLHQTTYNFNDDVAPVGASFFARMVETAQPLKGA
jgi:amidohydrolase